jgi:hypothetical protein
MLLQQERAGVQIAVDPPPRQVSKQTRFDVRYGLVAGILIGAAILGGCAEGVLDPKGPVAAAERLIRPAGWRILSGYEQLHRAMSTFTLDHSELSQQSRERQSRPDL